MTRGYRAGAPGTIGCVGSAQLALIAGCCTLAAAAPPSATEAHAFAVSLAGAGERLAGSAAERRAHQRVAARFRAAGLRVGYERFTVPGKGSSRDVIGVRDAPARCLVIAMAHAYAAAPGADDNASGVGTIVALARAARCRGRAPACDLWLVATGLRGAPLHRAGRPSWRRRAGARRLRRPCRLRRVRLALSLDEVGRGTRFELRSAVVPLRALGCRGRASSPRAAPTSTCPPGCATCATGNSDHRDWSLAGAPAASSASPDELRAGIPRATRPTACAAEPSPACCA